MSVLSDRVAELAPRLQEVAGEPVTYTTAAGVAAAIDILWLERENAYAQDNQGRMIEKWGIATVFEADVTIIGEGDKFLVTATSETWAFREKLGIDGTGHRMIFTRKPNENFGVPSHKS